MKKYSFRSQAIGFVVIAGTGLILLLQSCKFLTLKNRNDNPGIDQMLTASADSVDKTCPTWIDSMTELAHVDAKIPRIFHYTYCLKMDTTKYNMGMVKSIMRDNIFKGFIKTPDCKIFRDSSVTIIYKYTDMNHNPLFQLNFTPDTYK
jgi:hypothetical protein